MITLASLTASCLAAVTPLMIYLTHDVGAAIGYSVVAACACFAVRDYVASPARSVVTLRNRSRH